MLRRMLPWKLFLALWCGHCHTCIAKAPGCPSVPRGAVGLCMEECETDSDCDANGKAGHLCCSNSCGHICTLPARLEDVMPSHYVIMAVLQKDAAFAEITASIPQPASKSELRSLRMMTLKYSGSQKHEACQAFHVMSTHPKVSSVEFDGEEPVCANTEL
mmetsp:Transcript_16777/g.31730  ORF Transcript_16777/g.31730 Transcript_16777/m.31730 type:complete len:160 (-) Transcript_16777:6-485(-)